MSSTSPTTVPAPAPAVRSPILGRCACNQTQYQLLTAPLFVHCCHCRYCQRETGSAFVLNALIESDQVQLVASLNKDDNTSTRIPSNSPHTAPPHSTTTTEMINTPSESGRGQRITRCAHCHVALWSNYGPGGRSDLISFVRVGTLLEPDRFPPSIHIFTESKQPWVRVDGEVGGEAVPVRQQYYDRNEFWPSKSLERMARLIERAAEEEQRK